MNITDELFKMQDIKYRDFHSRLIPNIDCGRIIGVRTPMLRKFAKSISGSEDAQKFISDLPHKYYEENNLHAFLIEQYGSYEQAIAETERFLPYIDNWATCDSFLPKVFKKNTDKLIERTDVWLASDKTYVVRYAIGILMSLYLDENFLPEYAEKAADIRSDEYYVKMMQAWYFATALSKQYRAVIPYITEHRLDIWVHNKTIQKAAESRRIPDDIKVYLKSLKRKTGE